MNYQKTAYIALIIATIIRGSTFIVIKNTVALLDPYSLLAWRFMIASILIGLYLMVQGKYPWDFSWKAGGILGILFIFLYISQTIGLQYTSASNSGLITGMFILFTPFLAKKILGQTITKLHICSIILTLGGLFLLTGGIQTINIGDVITLITALSFALHIVYAEKHLQLGTDILVINFQQFFITSLICFLIAGYNNSLQVYLPIHTRISLGYLAIFGSIIAYSFQFYAQKHLNSQIVSILLSLEPVFAFIFAVIILGDPYDIYKILGIILVVFAMILSDIYTLLYKDRTGL